MKIKLIKFKSVKSTNDEAIKLIKKSNVKPCIIFTNNQTKGRGTMGKKWVSLRGNLFLSIIFQIDVKKITVKQLTILNVHLLKTVLRTYSKKKLIVKLPNDIQIEKQKISGILQELIKFKDKTFLIVGIGINTNHNPKINNQSTTSLKIYKKKNFSNKNILDDIKNIYEKFLSEIEKCKFSYLKKKYSN